MRKLKNYLIYKKKLLDFASTFEVSVIYKNFPGEGKAENKKITLDTGLSQSAEIATLLHELGHVLDDLSFTTDEYNKISKAYTRIYDDNCSREHKETVLEREKAAWKYGRNLATQLGIRLGKWFLVEEKVSIASYRKD